MKQEINAALTEQEKSDNVKILYACESGSRAWGFASPDSDYDVRFIYKHSTDWYLGLFEQRDVIEQPIDELLDISGWELRKALQLLYKSNAALLEWLHSPIIYRQEDEVINILRELAAQAFRPMSVCHHYLGMANKGWTSLVSNDKVKLKRYFYTLRALLCCEWVIHETSIPPVRFQDTLDRFYPQGEFRDAINTLLQVKSQSNESGLMDWAEYSELLRIVDSRITGLFSLIPGKIPMDTGKADRGLYEQSFRRILREY